MEWWSHKIIWPSDVVHVISVWKLMFVMFSQWQSCEKIAKQHISHTLSLLEHGHVYKV
jgi:hypothetical protein